MKVVLDASVAIKFYVREIDSDLALDWLAGDADLVAPDIFLVEVVQALLRHVREGRMSRSDLSVAARDLSQVVAVPSGSAALIEHAVTLAESLDHRLHDCMYLALAERLDCPLLTADVRLVRKVRERSASSTILALGERLP